MRTLTKLGLAMTDGFPARPDDDAPAVEAEPLTAEALAEAAGRLGITADRVAGEIAAVAFSDLSRIVDWAPGDEGLNIKLAKEIDPRDRAAIAEIVASASTGRIYRIKLHDKRGALDLLVRCAVMLWKMNAQNEDEQAADDGEDPVDFIVREIDRLAAEETVAPGAQQPVQAEQAENPADRGSAQASLV